LPFLHLPDTLKKQPIDEDRKPEVKKGKFMFHTIRGLAAAIALFLFMSVALFSQTPRELRFGYWQSGTLYEEEDQWFSIRPYENGLVVVETSGDTDTYLEAYDASCTLLAENDDGGEDLNARLSIPVEAGKTYLFKLRGYEESDSGTYQIRASFGTIRELRLGTWVYGTLREDENQWFSIQASGAGTVVVETSGNSDTYLEAYDLSGSVIADDDDSGEDYNARLEIFVEAGKTYHVKLSHFEDGGAPYQIRASFEPLPPDLDRNTELSRAVPIRLGESIPVYLRSPSESRWYRYDIARAGTSFVVQTRGNLDTILALYDGRGNLIEEDDDSGEGGNALISVKIGAGPVYIEVKEFEGQTGRCTLHAEIR